MVSKTSTQVQGHLGQGHEIFRLDVKLVKARVRKVSSRSAAFYASYLQKKNFGVAYVENKFHLFVISTDIAPYSHK